MNPPDGQVEAFLSRDLRQVWAVDRTTGEPHFLPDGDADKVRETARAQWKCPIPDCTTQISTRGGSRRDHFFHVGSGVGVSHGESAAHLSAKAMIARWARTKAGPGWRVAEEVGLKDEQTRFNRRPDVLATDGTTQIAFEVEYKQFAPNDWARKQADFDDNDVTGVWLLGHPRIRALRPAPGVTLPAHRVDVPVLAQAWARAGRVVLVVNPVEQMVGVLLEHDPHTAQPVLRLSPWSTTGWLAVDRLADCDFDPVHGIITPTMRRMLVDEAAAQVAQEAAERARKVKDETDAALREQKRQRIEVLQREQAAEWEVHPLRQTLLDRWGSLPDVLTARLHAPWGVWADETHWHAVIYERLIHDRRVWFPFSAIEAAFAEAGIRTHTNSKAVYHSVLTYLEHLERRGYIRMAFQRERMFTPLRNVGDPPHPLRQVTTDTTVLPPPPRPPQTAESLEAKWLRSTEHRRLSTVGDGVPGFVLDTNLLGPRTGNRDTRHFQAVIWLALKDARTLGAPLHEITRRTGGSSNPVRTYLQHLIDEGLITLTTQDRYRRIRGAQSQWRRQPRAPG